MVIQSRWLVNEKETRSKKRDIALKPRLDYATELVDTMLQILTQKRFNLDKNNAHLYAQIKESKYISNEFQKQLYDWAREEEVSSTEGFEALYLPLIGKDHGPKAAWLILKHKEFVKKRFLEVAES